MTRGKRRKRRKGHVTMVEGKTLHFQDFHLRVKYRASLGDALGIMLHHCRSPPQVQRQRIGRMRKNFSQVDIE